MPSTSSRETIQLGVSTFDRLNLPAFAMNWQVSNDGQTTQVHCLNRRRWVTLEPEEWVRQHWLHHLASDLGYPQGLISVEHAVELNGMKRFADIVCHDAHGQPLMILELKRPNVKLNKAVLDQALRYHLVMQSPWVVISNGIHHQGFRFTHGAFQALNSLPTFAASQDEDN